LASSCASPDRPAEFDDLGRFLDELLVEHEVPGASFALFDDSGLLFEHVAGVKSLTSLEPIDAASTFEAASISKPVFAYVVFSLARDGVLDVDAPLETLIPRIPELADDPRSSILTPRMLLTHRGGLPNWRSRLNLEATTYSDLFPPDDVLEFVVDPDTEYRYSGEGYVLLQRVVEARTGRSLNQLAMERVFEPLGMSRSSFLFDSEIRVNYALGHDDQGEPDKWELRVPLASSTLQTTATDLARFGAHLASEIRSHGTFAPLGIPAVTVEETGGVEYGWGPGLGVVTDGARRYVYHGGNNVIFIADFLYGIEENLGYVLLTNSSNGRRMVEAVEQRVFGRKLGR
jgi:CubicO group peptidase (beta-lactamase class C family)